MINLDPKDDNSVLNPTDSGAGSSPLGVKTPAGVGDKTGTISPGFSGVVKSTTTQDVSEKPTELDQDATTTPVAPTVDPVASSKPLKTESSSPTPPSSGAAAPVSEPPPAPAATAPVGVGTKVDTSEETAAGPNASASIPTSGTVTGSSDKPTF